jgi:hypothetical protein
MAASIRPKSLLTETFNSAEIRRHYCDARSQAAAFLFTVGSKALVLEEQKASTVIDHEGINDEAEIRARMVNEERIRSIRRKIMSKIALSVLKRGRDEKVRTVDIVLHHDKNKSTYLTWRSKLNYSKRFEIPSGTIVSKLAIADLHGSHPNSKQLGQGSSKRGSTTFEVVDINSTEFNVKHKIKEKFPSASFLRLTNAARSLDLSFQSPLELDAFLFILQKKVVVHVQPELIAISAASGNRR